MRTRTLGRSLEEVWRLQGRRLGESSGSEGGWPPSSANGGKEAAAEGPEPNPAAAPLTQAGFTVTSCVTSGKVTGLSEPQDAQLWNDQSKAPLRVTTKFQQIRDRTPRRVPALAGWLSAPAAELSPKSWDPSTSSATATTPAWDEGQGGGSRTGRGGPARGPRTRSFRTTPPPSRGPGPIHSSPGHWGPTPSLQPGPLSPRPLNMSVTAAESCSPHRAVVVNNKMKNDPKKVQSPVSTAPPLTWSHPKKCSGTEAGIWGRGQRREKASLRRAGPRAPIPAAIPNERGRAEGPASSWGSAEAEN